MALMFFGMDDLFWGFPLGCNVALIPSFLSGVFFCSFAFIYSSSGFGLYAHGVDAVDGLFVDQNTVLFTIFAFCLDIAFY